MLASDSHSEALHQRTAQDESSRLRDFWVTNTQLELPLTVPNLALSSLAF